MTIQEVISIYNNEIEGMNITNKEMGKSKIKKITKEELLNSLCYNIIVEEVINQIMYLRNNND